MSAFTVHWELFLRAKNEMKTRRILDQIERRLQVQLLAAQCVPYKNGELYRARLSTPSEDEARDWQNNITIKEVVRTQEAAAREVERLNFLNRSKDCLYVWQITRLERSE